MEAHEGSRTHFVWDMFRGWGVGTHSVEAGRDLLSRLTCGSTLEQGRIPVAVCATDIVAGERVVLRSGSAAEAAYASSALAGLLPPLRREGTLLVDGVYADIAPIDVAREFGNPVVIAVDAGQASPTPDIRNGFQAVMRAVEICHLQHARLRFDGCDFVLKPEFAGPVDTLDFDAKRDCIAAGIRAVRRNRRTLRQLLESGSAPDASPRSSRR